MVDLKSYIRDVADFPRRGILFRDISPLLRQAFGETIDALSALLDADEWSQVEAIAGVESRGFILASALALRHGKGFVLVRKKRKLPPPVVELPYGLEYGEGVLEMQPEAARCCWSMTYWRPAARCTQARRWRSVPAIPFFPVHRAARSPAGPALPLGPAPVRAALHY